MIHWRYTKGLNQDGNGNSLYTFLSFKAPQTDNASFNAVPELLYSDSSNGFGSANTWGHIITEKATGQSIDTVFEFKESIKIAVGKKIYTTDSKSIFVTNSNNNIIDVGTGYDRVDIAAAMKVYGALITHTNCNIVCGGAVSATGDITTSGGAVSATGDITTSGGKCQAVYFNATSDSRAKTDLAPLSINALDLIKRVQLYSFKYKDSKLPSIGILAQDVKDINIEGFKLVDNEEASGIDMDYMSIHESKLIYVLWKAIQEQQKEIDDLKAQLLESK